MDIDELKSQLKRFGIGPNKKLGQNFLLSDEVLDRIVEAANINQNDIILEIGPGLGALTRKLGERAGLVLAVEKDRKIVTALHRLFRNKKNIKIIAGDILFLAPEDIFNSDPNLRIHPNVTNDDYTNSDSKYSEHSDDHSGNSGRSYKLVANIPYYLTGKLLQNFLQPNANLRTENANDTNSSQSSHTSWPGSHYMFARPSLMVLLLQKEVAERITAKPGEHSILSITTQFYAEPEIVMNVPRENFYPVPKVDSAVIRLKIRGNPLFSVNDRKFFQLVKIGFSGKRKMLKNNLKALLSSVIASPQTKQSHGHETAAAAAKAGPRSDSKEVLEMADINPTARAQDLSLDDWKNLYDLLVP